MDAAATAARLPLAPSRRPFRLAVHPVGCPQRRGRPQDEDPIDLDGQIGADGAGNVRGKGPIVAGQDCVSSNMDDDSLPRQPRGTEEFMEAVRRRGSHGRGRAKEDCQGQSEEQPTGQAHGHGAMMARLDERPRERGGQWLIPAMPDMPAS
jgi:hypothetical protein